MVELFDGEVKLLSIYSQESKINVLGFVKDRSSFWTKMMNLLFNLSLILSRTNTIERPVGNWGWHRHVKVLGPFFIIRYHSRTSITAAVRVPICEVNFGFWDQFLSVPQRSDRPIHFRI